MVFPLIAKMFISAAPYVVLGFIIAGALHQWVPCDLLSRHLGGRGGLPLLKGVTIGSLLPICSCGTIPLGIGLYRCGGAIGTILAFMTSSPLLSPVMVLISFKLLGVKLASTLLGAALLGSLLIGWVGNWVLSTVQEKQTGETLQYECGKRANEHSFRNWFSWTFGELGSDVGVELVMGLGVATLVMAFLPLDFIAQWLGQGRFTSLILIVLLSLPVYTCSVPSVPIVQSLLLLGLSPGAAVVYLMAGPATNMGEINAIRANMGGRAAWYYATALIVVALSVGMITDLLIFPDYQYVSANVNGKLVVQQCCVPVLYNHTSIYAVNFSGVTPLEWASTMVLAWMVLHGICRHGRKFFTNPCQSCRWREYAQQRKCEQTCHVRRKHELFRRWITKKDAAC